MVIFLLCLPFAMIVAGPAWNAWGRYRRRTWMRELRAAYHS